MKIIILALFALAASQVAAYANAGAYERLWYWYMYLVDTDELSKPATKIAPRCANDMKLGSRYPHCNFNQFMQYIDAARIPKPVRITDEKRPDVEKTVQALVDAGHTGAYKPAKVHPSVGENDARGIQKLMQELNAIIRAKLPHQDSVIQKALQEATVGVVRARQESATRTIIKRMQEHGIKVMTQAVPLFKGSNKNVEVLHIHATRSANEGWEPEPGIKLARAERRKKMTELLRSTEDENHAGNIEAAQTAARSAKNFCRMR